MTPLRRFTCHTLWYVSVFAGGFFIHSLVSILLFLMLPLRVARRVSPAFRGWRVRDQVASAAVVLLGACAHAALFAVGGAEVWAVVIGWPLLVFAWVYSVLVYVYHYGTTVGPSVQYNVRSLKPSPVFNRAALSFLRRVGGRHVGQIDETYPQVGRILSDVHHIERGAFREHIESARRSCSTTVRRILRAARLDATVAAA